MDRPVAHVSAPTSIVVHGRSRVLEVAFEDGASYRIPFELMRVLSPSAEVQGHGPGQDVLQTGKREVEIVALEPVGRYGVQPTFSDGHDTGIFTWTFLRDLGARQHELTAAYEARLAAAGRDRDAPMGGAAPAAGHGCGHAHG
jgi:DUF971 family protein